MRRACLWALFALILVGTPAMAGQGEKGDWELGPYLGFGWLDDYEGLDPDDDVLYGGRVGYWFTSRWSLEASGQILSTETDMDTPALTSLGLSDNVDADLTSLRLNVLFHFLPGENCRPFLTVGAGSEKVDFDELGDSSDLGLNAGGGFRFGITERFGLRLDARWISVDVEDIDRQSNFETNVGASWVFGGASPSDADRDGVQDRQDRCPGTPVGAKVDAAGCPLDSDGDGVADGIDRCSNTTKGWPVDEKGCPRDTDDDGVADGEDACPNTPRGAKVDARGCTTDSDGDGVFDGLDRCDRTPAGARVDAYGCPLDADHDGVADGIDQCPGTKHGAKVDAVGCEIVEKEPQLFEEGKKSLVLEGVNFETNKADILPESAVILDRVAKALRDWPEVKVQVDGHTDSSGDAAMNMELSRRRAVSVRAYLVQQGVEESRMKVKGYGETKPLESNRTPEGRAKNRRVELTRID